MSAAAKLENHKAPLSIESEQAPERGGSLIALFALVTALSFVLLIWQNPSSVLPRTTLYFDSAHYLETCKRLYESVTLFFQGGFGAAQLDALAFHLMLDGPVLPLAGAASFALCGKLPSAVNFQVLVGMQCVFQALCAGFVFLLSETLFQNKKTALSAAFLWTLYPSTAASCNSFLTEPLACLLSVAVVYFLSKSLNSKNSDPAFAGHSRSNLNSAAAGLSLALLALLKPALAPAASLAALVTLGYPVFQSIQCFRRGPAAADFFQTGKNLLSVSLKASVKPLFAGIGIAIVILPWLIFTYAARHELIVLPSRRPVYNITTGCNIEGDGWGCHPTHPIAADFDDSEQALPVMLGLLESNPAESCDLALRKLSRLWTLPWNDYRYSIFGLNYKVQALLHLVLVLAGFSGLCLLFASIAQPTASMQQKLTVFSIIAFVAGHLIYLPFEGIARYGFSAMPFLTIAAVFNLSCLFSCRRALLIGGFLASSLLFVVQNKFDSLPFLLYLTNEARTAALLAAGGKLCALASLAFFVYKLGCLNFEKPGQWMRRMLALSLALMLLLSGALVTAFALSARVARDWPCRLASGQSAVRQVNIQNALESRPDWALLLFDTKADLSSCEFRVNGKVLSERPLSIYQFYGQRYELEDWTAQFASLLRKSPETMRKWRAVPVPLSYLHEAWNELELAAVDGGVVTVYGDYTQGRRHGFTLMPSSSEFSPGKFFNDSEDAFDSRIMQSTYCRACPAKSFLRKSGASESGFDLAPAPGLQTGQYRISLLLGYKHGGAEQKSLAGSLPESRSAAQMQLSEKLILSNKTAAEAGGKTQCNSSFELSVPPAVLCGTHLNLIITGRSKLNAGRTAQFSLAAISDGAGRFMASVFPGTPQLISCSGAGNKFKLESQLPASAFNKNSASKIRVELRLVSGDLQIEDLNAELQAVDKPEFRKHSLRYF